MSTPMERAAAVLARCEALAAFTDEPGRLTRAYGTVAHRQAQEQVAQWMRDAGMAVRRDAVGNLIGCYESNVQGAKRLLIGSHLDTVRDAGKYDGILGVLVAIDVVHELHRRAARLPIAVEVVAFADEEGLRFQTTYLGSRALTGGLDEATLSITDQDGITVAQAIRAFGGDPKRLDEAKRNADELLGYVEVHIEQGPVLESLDLPVGVVTAIAGQTRIAVEFAGQAGHAGTVPMELRRDALSAASELVLAVETTARQRIGLVATVGQLSVAPGASNVVPGHVALTVDVRHPVDTAREQACVELEQRAAEIARHRDVQLTWRIAQATLGVTCDPALSESFARAVATAGYPVKRLPSGAGHDAVALSALTPVAMLFVRCAGGVSHHPAEAVAADDVAVAIEVMDRLLAITSTNYSVF